ncbi:MAG TPA: DUF2752 domain-containing protein [Candidatus Dormibacteraeota bacterium]|jgi:hypothetical protein
MVAVTSYPARRLEGREAAVAAGGATLLATAWVLPELWAHGIQPIPQCLFYQVTGIPCPFCGGTRSFAAIAHGNLGAAAHVFPIGPLMFAALVVAVVYCCWVLVSGRKVQVVLDDRLRRGLILAAGALLLVNWASKIFILGY